MRGIGDAIEGKESPVSSLMAVYERMHLWITDFIMPCHDQDVVDKLLDKTDGKKVKNSKAPVRVKNWATKGHKKLESLQKRVCINVVQSKTLKF